ncbi:MAG: hypothetical protein GY849_08275, partial [Deltaproteobacteria bacterium]|nr:hypothetical protein [Deltaproteobacteria bacterium]
MVHLKRRDEGILKKYLTLFVALLFVLALTSIGFAAGKISIKPIISIGARYDSNYHKTERHKRAVMTYMAKPGIQFGYESAKFAVLFNYTLEGYLYDDVGHGHRGYQETSDLAYLGHLGSLDVRYSPTDRLTFVLEDGFYLSRYPTSYDRLSDTIERRKYWVNRLTPGVIFDFEHRVTAALRYRWTRKHFLETGETGDESDSVEHRAMANFIYRPTRTMTFDLNYNIYWMNYDDYERGDYTSSEIRLDLQKRFRSFAFDAGVGWHHRSYHDYDDDQSGRDALTYKVSALWQDPPPPPEAMRRPGKRFMRPRSEVYMAAESNFNHYGANFRGYRFTLDAGHVFFN